MEKQSSLPEEYFLELENRIQSLIDGDLDAESRRELLQTIDSENHGHWRYIALGFVERQIICNAISEKSKSADEIVRVEQAKSKQHWAVAACFGLLLLAGGWWLGAQNNPTQESGVTLAKESDAPGILNIQSISEAAPFSLSVPVFDTTKDRESARVNLANSHKRLRAAEKLLQSHGYETNTKTQFITASLKDGRRLILPVNHIVFQTVQN